MATLLQVLVEEDEAQAIREVAEARHMTVAEWMRMAIRDGCRQESKIPSRRKLAIVRAAAIHRFPTADIDQMLAEIGRSQTFGVADPGS